MKVKIKKLVENAVIPTYAHNTDAGMDLTATSRNIDTQGNIVYGTGIAVEIPQGYVGLVFPRSSIAKTDLSLSNAVGVIDSGYRGEITFKFRYHQPLDGNVSWYRVGERIGQLIIMPYPKIEFEEVEELSETDRNLGGFGSTGK